ncbi:hypothetical protein RE440_22890, partial [Bacillus licheniformis]
NWTWKGPNRQPSDRNNRIKWTKTGRIFKIRPVLSTVWEQTFIYGLLFFCFSSLICANRHSGDSISFASLSGIFQGRINEVMFSLKKTRLSANYFSHSRVYPNVTAVYTYIRKRSSLLQ